MLGLTTAESEAVVVQDLNFDSVYDWYNGRDVVDAIRMGGTNLTVRDCSFGHVTMCLNTNLEPVGVFSYGNDAVADGGVRAYYLWGEGSDHTHLGNTVSGSTHEHVIRFGGLNRALIGYNDLRNDDKRTIWCMSGKYAYVVGNMLRDGRFTIGSRPCRRQRVDAFQVGGGGRQRDRPHVRGAFGAGD